MKYQNLMAILVLAAGFAFSVAVDAVEEGQSRSRCWSGFKSCCKESVSTAVNYAEDWSKHATEASAKLIKKLKTPKQRHALCKSYLKHLGYTTKDDGYKFIIGMATADDYSNGNAIKTHLLAFAKKMAAKEAEDRFWNSEKKLQGDLLANIASVVWTLSESAMIVMGTDVIDTQIITDMGNWHSLIIADAHTAQGLESLALSALGYSFKLISMILQTVSTELAERTAAASDGGGVVPVVVPVGGSVAADTVATV